jgi:hypothetical protein
LLVADGDAEKKWEVYILCLLREGFTANTDRKNINPALALESDVRLVFKEILTKGRSDVSAPTAVEDRSDRFGPLPSSKTSSKQCSSQWKQVALLKVTSGMRVFSGMAAWHLLNFEREISGRGLYVYLCWLPGESGDLCWWSRKRFLFF